MRTLDPDRQGRLRDVSILLSASVPDREGFERVPDAAFVIEQAVVSLARAVLAEGGTLVFGAHPSISPLVASVASEYRAPGGKEEPRVLIYQSKAFEKVLPRETWDMARFGFARLIWIDAEGGENYIPGQPASRHCPQSLRSMRQHMISDLKPAAMVVMGGMVGIFEEVEIFRTLGEPLYVAESTGGAARQLVQRQDSVTWIEREWEKAHPARHIVRDSTRDPREVPIPPYAAIMQWLVSEIADGRR